MPPSKKKGRGKAEKKWEDPVQFRASFTQGGKGTGKQERLVQGALRYGRVDLKPGKGKNEKDVKKRRREREVETDSDVDRELQIVRA